MKNQKGFLLISLIIVLAIIALILAIEYGKSGGFGGNASVLETGQKAENQVKENNAIQQQQNIDIQNQLNSDDTSATGGQRAIQQAKGALGK